MKTTDLRCGNLVYKVIEDFEPCNPKIHTWSESDWYSILECVSELDWFKPIPLTEEWLVKFGFEYIKVGKFNHDEKWVINGDEFLWQLSSKKRFFHDFYNGGEIKYVHQLQNLYYALTNEELTLNK